MRTTPVERIDDLTQRGWWGEQTLDDLFQAAVKKNPQHLALVDQYNREEFTDGAPQRLNFSELANCADNLAAKFFEHGMRQDDVVIVQLPNIAELAILYLALGKLGVILSPVPVQYGRFELEKAADVVRPSAYISLANLKGENFTRDHSPAFSNDCKIFCFGENVPSGAISIELSSAAPSNDNVFRDYVAGLEITANDIFTICWTSGTTGDPKGVPRSHNMWMASALGSHDAATMRDHEVHLNPFPIVNMAAIGGFLFCWMMRSTTLVLHHPFDMQVFLKQIQDEKVAYTIAPPAVLTMLLKKPEVLGAYDISSLRCVGSGSAPLTEFMVAGFGNGHGIDILNIFGSNEGICLASGPKELPDFAERAQFFPRFGVDGLDWPNRIGANMKTRLISLDSGELVTGTGERGELEIWGATVFDGYFDSPEANASVFSDDGYFRTGDVFEITGDGKQPKFYKFVGRCKDIIVRGGVKISPNEIDSLLAAHPNVVQVCVVGVDDEIMGERVGVAVVPKPDQTVTLDDLAQFLKDKGVAVFKLPERLICVDQLPHNATGKIQRRDVKQMFDGQQDS